MKATKKKLILGRYAVVVGIMLLMSTAVVYSLVRNTVFEAAAWNAKADSLLTRETPVIPDRGKIFSDNGAVLAANLNYYVPRIDWTVQKIKLKPDTVDRLLRQLGDSLAMFQSGKSAKQWYDELKHEATSPKPKRSYRLFKELTHNEYERLKTFPFLNLPKSKNGFYYDGTMRRVKPYGSMASRSVGNIGPNNHGRSGLEMALDSLLYGVEGKAKSIQLNSGMAKWESVPAVNGYDITTTINIGLQDIVENELYDMCRETDARWGTAVLMETATGEIKAISNLEWNSKQNDYIEGTNHAVLGYEPGSVMKPISMMVALEDGKVGNINTPIATGTSMLYCGKYIKDPHGGAALSPVQIIETSSNIGMSKIILRDYESNPDGFRQRLEQMGFFAPYNTGIAGEQLPHIRKVKNNAEGRLSLTRMAFGYATEIPPMRILAMYNAIANGGKYVRPRLVKELSREGGPDSIVPVSYIRKQVCSPENAAKLREMLHAVVWGSRGTARKWVQDDRVEIAGKTGTAYVTENGRYTSQKRLAFCGFFPYKNPKYTCVVLMAGANRGAGASSGVVLKNIALKMYARGLLGNQSDYRTDGGLGGQPRLFASYGNSMRRNVARGLGLSQMPGAFTVPKPCGGVPDVRGLNVREAVARLEGLGLNVRLSGAGYVGDQSLMPGTAYHRGQTIELRLSR